jgi:uncharacterized coiled-coil protein SlyX
MQDTINLRDRLTDLASNLAQGHQEIAFNDLVKMIADLDRQIKAYDDYMDRMASEQKQYEDRVAASA